MRRALIVAPHQDDETIGCAGTMSILGDNQYEVSTVHVYKGNTGVNSTDQSDLRQKEAEEAGRILGSTTLPNLGFRDREDHDLTALTKSLTAQIRKHTPNILFLPHEQEKDYEHQRVSKAGLEASWLAGSTAYPEIKGRHVPDIIFFYEVWTPLQEVNIYIDITHKKEIKRSALQAYKTQMATTSWISGTLGLNAYRGCVLQGKGLVEAFRIKAINMDKLSNVVSGLKWN